MKTKFVTCIYSNLFGTKFGGRQSRSTHYRYSLLSLMKMKNAKYICYTSEGEFQDLSNFFYQDHGVNKENLELRIFDLSTTHHENLFQEYKNYADAFSSDRCLEIQYAKFELLKKNLDDDHDYFFWVDAGLSHCGLIPNKYLTPNLGCRSYYESQLFNDNFLQNLINFTHDKIFIIGKENQRNFWSQTVDRKHFENYSSDYHVIGGIFGGNKASCEKITDLFEIYADKVTRSDGVVYPEENIMTVIWRNNEDYFSIKFFDTWWHEDERISGLDMVEHLKINKSFYKILEELNE